MFLDDKIVELVLSRSLETDQIKVVNDVFKLCIGKISDDLHYDMHDQNILPATKRACNLFDSAARKLKSLNYDYLKEGGLRTALLNNDKLGEILKKQGL